MKNRLANGKPGAGRLGGPMQNEKENDQDLRKAADGQKGADIGARPKVESTDFES